MQKLLNDQPLEHHCHNGTVFKADRCDLVGGMTAFVPRTLSRSQSMEDAAEFGAWHWANIVPQLNGFTGPAAITLIRMTQSEYAFMSRPLLEAASLEALRMHETHTGTASRVFKFLQEECEWIAKVRQDASEYTVEQFVEEYTVTQLLRGHNLGKRSVELLVHFFEEHGIKLSKS